MLLYSVGALWVIGGQHGVAACDEICKDVTARMGEGEDWTTNFDVRIIKFDTSIEIRRKMAGQHNRAQHSGRESSVPQLLNMFLQLAAEDIQCKKTAVTLMCEAIVEAGLTAKSGNTETIVKQMRPTAHMALTCCATFTDALGKMVERKQVIALYTMRCFAGMQPDNLWRVCNYMVSPKSTVPGFQKLAKELRAGELWWYHFGHSDMPVERIHPSRHMLLLCKPLRFVVIGPLRQGAWMKCNDRFQCDSSGLLGSAEPRIRWVAS